MTANKLPDGPQTPSWLQKIQWSVDPIGYMETAAKSYGDLFKASVLPFLDTFFVSHPQALQQILRTDSKQFVALKDGNKMFLPLLGEHSVIMLEGDRHQRERKLLMPPLHGDRLRTYGQLICQITKQVMDRLPVGKPFIAHDVMQSISLQIIIQILFGISEGERYQQIQKQLSLMLESFESPLLSTFLYLPSIRWNLGPSSPWGYFLRKRKLVDELIYAEIKERRAAQNQNHTDLLSLLIEATDEEGQSMTDLELRDELMTLLFAGHETTTSTLTWALYWVHYLPEIKKKLLKKLGEFDQDIAIETIAKIPYLNAVCNETLRIYPVALTFPRLALEPVEIMGYKFPTNTALIGCIYLTHHRQDIYPNSKQFNPERFIEQQFSPYEFMPFGAGLRRCIGAALAQYKLKLVLATILLNFKLKLADSQPAKPQRRSITFSPKGGLRMVMEGQQVS